MISRRILSGALCTMAMLVAYGCSDNPSGNSEANPDPPRNLRAIDVSDTSVSLQWDAPADSAGIAGYRVWWKKSGATVADSADVATPAMERAITGLTPGATYTLSVASKRGSKISSPATIEWMSILAPTGLTVSFSDYSKADLQWTASTSAGTSGYLLSWKGSAGDSSSTTVAAGATSAQLTALVSSSSYTFYLRARQDARLSSPAIAKWTAVTLGAPTGLAALSAADSSVKLRWAASSDTGTIGYVVSWRASTGGDSATATTASTSWSSPKLAQGTTYELHVQASRGIARSAPVSITWAPAKRFTLEPANATLLTIYEQGSPYGNILAIDPEVGGPRRLTSAGAPAPNSLQLALFVSGSSPKEFEIGPANAFPSFLDLFGLDTNTFISNQAYRVGGLDSWYLDAPLDGMFSTSGNVSEFYLPTTLDDSTGMGFVVRTGMPGNYHYARIFVLNVNGELLQGSSPHRFINLEVSYQLSPNVPYAKAGMRSSSPAALGARRAR